MLTVKSWAAAKATKAARATKMGRDMVYCSDAGKTVINIRSGCVVSRGDLSLALTLTLTLTLTLSSEWV